MEWEKVEAVTDFIFLYSKITVDGDCSHEIKRCLFLGSKARAGWWTVLAKRLIEKMWQHSEELGLTDGP